MYCINIVSKFNAFPEHLFSTQWTHENEDEFLHLSHLVSWFLMLLSITV